MTITTQTLRNDYTANGSNTSFAFAFPIFYESNSTPKFSLEVITTDANGVETTKTETTDYTVSYSSSNLANGVISQGNIVFGTAPTNGHKVSILRKLNLTQNGDFTDKGTDALNGATLESALDKLTLLSLQQQENLNRVVKLPKSSQLTNIEFPIDATRADQAVVINTAGNNLTTKNLADISLATLTNFAKTLMDDNNASEARTTLDAQQLNANLSALAGLTGASNKLPYFTGAGAMAVRDLLATTTTQGISYLNNPITIANNVTTPNTDIDFSGGVFQFSDGTGQAVAPALTKRLQSSGAWSAGAGGNLLTTGARANSSTYHLYAIYNPTTLAVDYMALLGVAGTAPDPTSALPSGYTKFALRASIITDSSGNIRTGKYKFFNGGYDFIYNTKVADATLVSLTTTKVSLTVSVPAGIKVKGSFNVLVDGIINAKDSISLFEGGTSIENSKVSGGTLLASANSAFGGTIPCDSNLSRQIDWKTDNYTLSTSLWTYGFTYYTN